MPTRTLLAVLLRGVGVTLLGVSLSGGAAAQAAKPDRDQPLTFDAGQMKIDGKRKVRMLSGGVELTRGSFVLKAGEVEVRDAGRGQIAVAVSSASQPATFRQKRDGVDETVQGSADRIEYDSQTETVRLVGKAALRRFRGTVLSEEVSGQTIIYDREHETFEVSGSATGAAAPNGGGTGSGRVKGVVTPVAGDRP